MKNALNQKNHHISFENAVIVSARTADGEEEEPMMRTSEPILENGEIVTESGRVFRPGKAELLDALPADIVREMAKRRLAEIAHYKAERANTGSQK